MSGVQILTSFFTDQISQAQQKVDRILAELQTETDDNDRARLQQELVKARAYLNIASETKVLFDANRLTERRLKDTLQALRGGTNG
jgi:hypothetical protein